MKQKTDNHDFEFFKACRLFIAKFAKTQTGISTQNS